MKLVKFRPLLVFSALAALFGAALAYLPPRFTKSAWISQKMRGQATVSDRVEEFGPRVDARWKPFFQRAGVTYPPQKLIFLGLKAEKRLEIYTQNFGKPWRFVRALPIVRA